MGHRYIGTKTRIVDWVISAVRGFGPDGGHVVDLMTGTATVAVVLRDHGYRVTANDVMTYSYHHARVALLLSEAPPFVAIAGDFAVTGRGAYCDVLHGLSGLPPVEGYFFTEFSRGGCPANGSSPRNYFTSENAARIDAMRMWIRDAARDGRLTEIEHSLLLHDLIMAANDVANIAGTYGHYLSRTVERARVPLALSPTPLDSPPGDVGGHVVLRGYAEDVAASLEADVCYIDPPYMKRQYAANYHILETLARGDEPEAAGASGLRPWRDQYSNFCTKTKIRDSFRKIFGAMNCPVFIISYSEDGLLSLASLTALLGEFGAVEVQQFPHKRFRSNNSQLAPELAEYLLILSKDA